MAHSLERSTAAFTGREEENNQIVLISDGVETCDGDPCAVAEKLAAANIGVKVHVVGFDIDKKNRSQLECIAQKGGGRYFSAESTKGFTNAIKQATQVTEAPTPPPPTPEWKVVFEDNFDGEFLSKHWKVLNPDPDAMIVENGELMILSTTKGTLSKDNNTISNMLVLDQPLPRGDWRMTMRYRAELGSLRGWTALGLFKDPAKRLQAYMNYSSDWGGSLYLKSLKLSSGSPSGNEKVLYFRSGRGSISELNKKLKSGIELQLLKKGRSYISQGRLVDDPEKPWKSLPKLTSLRPIGTLFIASSKGKGGGEDLFYIDRVTIEELTVPEAGVSE